MKCYTHNTVTDGRQFSLLTATPNCIKVLHCRIPCRCRNLVLLSIIVSVFFFLSREAYHKLYINTSNKDTDGVVWPRYDNPKR